MEQSRIISGGVTAPQGFLAAGVAAGIKQNGNKDVALLYSAAPAVAAAVFTTNAFAAAPVQVSRRTAARGVARAVVANSGCANACTGAQGLADAVAMAELAGKVLDIAPQEVFVASTGVIGRPLPMQKIAAAIRAAAGRLSPGGAGDALAAIMTTDTRPKEIALEFNLAGQTVRLGAMAKGSGMIHPNMATMLAFITTDANILPCALKKALQAAVEASFHMVTVDGDTSTNDMVVALANGQAGNKEISSPGDPGYDVFAAALTRACVHLAQCIARDGEGATKFLAITVRGAVDFTDAKRAAMAIARSPLVKTAFFGEDPNWGRILCAVGYAGIQVDPGKVSLFLGDVPVVRHGLPLPCQPEILARIMAGHDIDVTVDLALGEAAATVWTCDLSHEYVRINGEYTT